MVPLEGLPKGRPSLKNLLKIKLITIKPNKSGKDYIPQ